MRLLAEFFVEYHTQNTRRRARMNSRSMNNQEAVVVVLCPYLGEVNKDILLWD